MKKKTHRSAAKRFKLNAAGKIFRRKAGYVHKLTKKRAQYRRQARRKVEVTGAEYRRMKKLLQA